MENIILKKLVEEQKLTCYELSKRSGVPYSTINDLLHDKKNISNITGKNLYLIARTLKTTSEFLLKPVFYEEIDFDLFRSNVCHFAKHNGKDYIDILIQENDIRAYDYMGRKAQSLYLLGMLDHLCHKYEVPLKEEYADLRKTSLDSYLYPKSVITLYIFDSRVLYRAVKNADPDFIKFKIVEGEVEDVA